MVLVDLRIVPIDANGSRAKVFDEAWAAEFGDKIKAEASGLQFVALRARSTPDLVKGGFDTTRATLERWPDYSAWATEKVKETRVPTRLENLHFVAVDAQRDIYQELHERTSFIGRVLSGIAYEPSDTAALEELIHELNDTAVARSQDLIRLKQHFEQLNKSVQGAGNAEVMPFPKKIRDLSKNFSLHVGETADSSFSMEYHGMGTRSWASMLAVKAFIDLLAAKHAKESEPFFSVLAAEEPEAHLHPNAQKTLYQQLVDSSSQVIISTHSPFLAAMAESDNIVCLKRTGDCVNASSLSNTLTVEDNRRLRREVIHSRGEILFSKAIVLCEGETEEQASLYFSKSTFGNKAFTLGVNFVAVGGSGKKYLPFLRFACDLDIPIFVFSDGEAKTIRELASTYKTVFGPIDMSSCPHITVLDNTDFEGYLMSCGYGQLIEAAICETDGSKAIDNWIVRRDKTSAGREKSDAPPCPTCKQFIYADVLRDYSSSGGRDRAMRDILDSGKPKYAPVIASKLCELDLGQFPS